MQNRYLQYLSALKSPFRKVCKLEFLQPDNSVAFVLDNNISNKRSQAFLQEGTISVNLQNGQRRQASITLSNIDGNFDYSVNKIWFGQRIRISEGLILPDGTEFYLPQGVFYPKEPKEVHNPSKRTMTFSLVDKWAMLDGTLGGKLDGIYEVPANSNIFSAISSLLSEDMGNGQPYDNVPPAFTNYYNDLTTTLPDGSSISNVLSPYTLRVDSDNSSRADVILSLNAMLVGWVGYDQTGRFRLTPSQDDILDISKPVQWSFSPSESQFLGATYRIKNTEVKNDIIVTGESLGSNPQANGRASNFDPSSDTNINMIGYKTERISKQGFYTNDICEAQAAFELKRKTVLQKAVDISSTQMFHLTENNLVEIRRIDKPGAPVERHLIQGFTRPLGEAGSMTITATSVVDFPIATIQKAVMSWQRLVTNSSDPLLTSTGELLWVTKEA